VTGVPGIGKSVALRLLVERLSMLREIKIGVMSRPHPSVADFYRELGHLFGVQLSPRNRWAGAKVLRERWQAHIDGALVRPVLVVDEAPKLMTPELIATLCEHAAGNYRALMMMAGELLTTGAEREVKQLDEKLFFDAYTPEASRPSKKRSKRR